MKHLPHITVGTAEYNPDDEDDLIECIEGVLSLDYPSFDLVVLSEAESISETVRNTFDDDRLTLVESEELDGGISEARNIIADHATGDVMAYIDSDAVPADDWLHELGRTYRDRNVIAVGGRAEPVWEDNRPAYLSDEFLWLVGATHAGHPPDGSIVRSTFGCNMSFRTEILDELQFNENLGKDHGYNLQGEEPELGARMQKQFSAGMIYNEDAIVYHKVSPEQTTLRWLSRRAYLQGISKAVIEKIVGSEATETEDDFLRFVLLTSVPLYLGQAVKSRRVSALIHLLGLLYFTALVGAGFIVGRVRDL